MRTHVVRIGNSRGLRIPKPVLEQTGITDEVELEVDGSRIIIRSPHRVRAGWEDAFRAQHARGDDALIDGDTTGQSSWDDEEWRW